MTPNRRKNTLVISHHYFPSCNE